MRGSAFLVQSVRLSNVTGSAGPPILVPNCTFHFPSSTKAGLSLPGLLISSGSEPGREVSVAIRNVDSSGASSRRQYFPPLKGVQEIIRALPSTGVSRYSLEEVERMLISWLKAFLLWLYTK